MPRLSPISVFEFKNYRLFLKAYYQRESKDNGLTHAQFAQRAQLKSPNYLKLVIDGLRNLTSENIFKFSRALKLNHIEEEFFEALVRAGQASVASEKRFYKKRVMDLLNKPSRQQWSSEKFLYESWMTPVCLVAAHGRSKEETLTFLHKKVGLQTEVIEKQLQTFESKKALALSEDGRYTIHRSFTSVFDPSGLNLSQAKLLKSEISRMLRTFDEMYGRQQGKYINNTLTASSDGGDIIKEKLLDTLAGLAEDFDRQASVEEGDIFTVNIQVVPARTPKAKS